jgi:Uncharacterised nucleotidyltransferase
VSPVQQVRFEGWQFPSATKELLLEAALQYPEKGYRAWQLWRRQTDLSRLDAGVKRLLPLVYRNLGSHWPEDPALASLQGVYRKTWSQNQMRLRTLSDLLTRFQGQGIELMMLKGGALILLAYRDFGVRPMTDLDLLVRREAAPQAIHWLREWGWKPSLDNPELLMEIRHGDEFTAADGQRVDLHWNVLQECCGPGSNDDFWRQAMPCDIGFAPCKSLCAADQLLHVIVHGARWSLVQPLGWIADASVLIRSAGATLEWDRFIQQARSRRLVAPVREALEYLRARMGAEIPLSSLDALRRVHVPFMERVEHSVKIRPRPLVGTLPVLGFDYLRLTEGQPAVKRLLRFGKYLQLTFDCRSFSELVISSARLVAARCRAYLQMRFGGSMPPPRLRDPGRVRPAKSSGGLD